MSESSQTYYNQRSLREECVKNSELQTKIQQILESGRVFQEENLLKAVEKNLSYQRLLRKHMKSLDHLLEANNEKRRVLWQTLALANTNSEYEKVRLQQTVNNDISQKVIFSAPWFVDDEGNTPPPNPDSAHFHKMVSTTPLRPTSRQWTQEEKEALQSGVYYAAAAYHRRKRLWASALSAQSTEERDAALHGIAESKTRDGGEIPCFDSEDEDDAPLVAMAARVPLPPRGVTCPVRGHVGACAWGSVTDGVWQSRCAGVDVAWTAALHSEQQRIETLEREAMLDPAFQTRLGSLSPFPMVSAYSRAEALFFTRHNDPLTLHLAPATVRTTEPAHVPITRVNWNWIARNCVRGGRTALQCAQMWRNAVDPAIGTLTDVDKKMIAEAVAAHPPSTPGAAPPINWYSLAASLPLPRPPLLLLTHYFRKTVSRRWNHPFSRLAALHRVFGEDWRWIARELECTTEQVTAQWLRRGANQRTGKWSKEEDVRLILAAKAYTRPSTGGPAVSWAEVAAMVPGRSEVQCRERFMNALGKRDSREPVFTPDAEDRLLMAVRSHGYDWSRVANEFPDLGARAARLKWFQICSQEERDAYLRHLRTPTGRVVNEASQRRQLKSRQKLRRAIRGEVFDAGDVAVDVDGVAAAADAVQQLHSDRVDPVAMSDQDMFGNQHAPG